MAGALARARYADGGDVGALSSEEAAAADAANGVPEGGGEQGALSVPTDVESAEEKAAYSGALSRLGGAPQQISEASKAQLDAIERAKRNIQGLARYTPNPSAWFNAAMMGGSNTGRFGSELGNAFQGGLRGQEAAGNFATQQAGALNNLELAGGRIPFEAQAAQQKSDEAMLNTIAVERARREAIQARKEQTLERVAEQHYRDQQLALSAQERAEATRYAAEQRAGAEEKYIPAERTNPDTGKDEKGFLHTVPGKPAEWWSGAHADFKPSATASAGVLTFREKLAAANAAYPDDAQMALDVALNHKLPDPDKAAAAATKLASEDLRAAMTAGTAPNDAAGVEAWLKARRELYLKGMTGDKPAAGGAKPAAAPAAKPAAKGTPAAKAAPGAAPAPGSAAARAAFGLPLGSQYNTKLKQWRDPSGKIYDDQGKPVPGGG